MTQLAEKKIRIGKATIGLIGLDQAMNQAREQNLDEDAALDFIYKAVSRENYIPSTAVGAYKNALRSEYQRLISGSDQKTGELIIKILGPGCVSCNKLNTMIFDIMQRLSIAADIEQIHDLDEIWRHGVISTPALIINGQIKCSGRMPPPAEVEKWLVEAADRD
ncbi:MAG: thioredoxin family protein [Desulfobulbaceae bacterium]|nr:thioredoxin family protein [Desulfobulbaceae bacterium]